MQADGLNQLAISTAGRGDAGDPFPGSSNNTAFTFTSNPSSKSYAGGDTTVEITNISNSATTMTMDITVRSFTPAYAQGSPGSGIGGYDLHSSADLAFAYDPLGSWLDHLVLYRPGTGKCWILQNNSGTFTPIYASDSGIAGYDLRSVADRGLAYDYRSKGVADSLIFYRPGQGAIFIITPPP